MLSKETLAIDEKGLCQTLALLYLFESLPFCGLSYHLSVRLSNALFLTSIFICLNYFLYFKYRSLSYLEFT